MEFKFFLKIVKDNDSLILSGTLFQNLIPKYEMQFWVSCNLLNGLKNLEELSNVKIFEILTGALPLITFHKSIPIFRYREFLTVRIKRT